VGCVLVVVGCVLVVVGSHVVVVNCEVVVVGQVGQAGMMESSMVVLVANDG
jgi:hypothetical protein